MVDIKAFPLGVSVMYLVKDKEMVIIDTGCEVGREKYVEIFAELGVDPKDIKLIIITHGHSDHFGRVFELKELTGAPVVCHRNAAGALQTGTNPPFVPRGEEGKEFFRLIQPPPAVSAPVNPDLVFDEEFDLAPYGVAGKIFYTPGHSDCSTSIVLDSGEAFVGDMVLTSPVSEKLVLALLATDVNKLSASMEFLLRRARVFYGGHGGPYTKEEIAALLKG